VLQVVRRNFGLKVLAVALAILGWAYFRIAGNSVIDAGGAQLSIPITVVNLPLGYVARFTDHEAVVTVGAGHGTPAPKPDQVKAVLDLANKGTGVYNVPVQLVAPDVVVQSLSPASVTLTVERIEQRSFPIGVHYVGAQRADVVVSGTDVLPRAALVRAAASLLEQVAAVNVDVTLPNAPRAVDEMVRPVAVDASGAELPGLSVTPNLVRVQSRFVSGTAAK
jgi:YbbR domain-containing protein